MSNMMEVIWAVLTDLFDRTVGLLSAVWAALPSSGEYWSGIIGAVVGAVVGGYISYLVQLRALRETREQRQEDRLQVQRALANSLLFKTIRIYSDFHSIHRHVEDCYEKAAADGFKGEPWQVVLPLANFPDAVHFLPDEMGLILGLKADNVFNEVIDLDVIHNALIDAVKVMSTERRSLADRLTPDSAEGSALSGELDHKAYFALKPRMIEVNSIIDSVRVSAKNDAESSGKALRDLHKLLKDKLGLTYTLQSKFASNVVSPSLE